MSLVRRGTVYGTLMNFRGELDTLGDKVKQPPYNAPPQAPVLYVKPANTWTENGGSIVIPAGVPDGGIGAPAALGRNAAREGAGYVLMNDVAIPHDSFYRPPVKFNCVDGFLGIGDRIRARN